MFVRVSFVLQSACGIIRGAAGCTDIGLAGSLKYIRMKWFVKIYIVIDDIIWYDKCNVKGHNF